MESKSKLVFGTKFMKNMKTKNRSNPRTNYYDYYVINKSTYDNIPFGEVMMAIINAVKNNLFDDILKAPNNKETIINKYFKEKLYDFSELLNLFTVSSKTVSELKRLYDKIVILERTKCNSEAVIKSIIIAFKSEKWYLNIKKLCLYVDYGFANTPYCENLNHTIKMINHRSNSYSCHTEQEVHSLLDICLITLFYTASYKRYICKCRTCNSFVIGNLSKSFCYSCRHKTNLQKFEEYRSSEIKSQYIKIYNRLYRRILRSDGQEKIQNQKVFDEYCSKYNDLIIYCSYLSPKERNKKTNDFFALWRSV